MIAVLLACSDPTRTLRPPQWTPSSSPATPADTATERPILAPPPEATDLDPDPGIVRVSLTAAPLVYEVGGIPVEGYAYEGTVPGPTLRARTGDTLVVDFTNDLPDPTTVHWHGANVPNAMDGAGWPMPEVLPGGQLRYEFALDRAGTFWYHPHLDTEHQVDRGLYGVLVVEDPDEPVADAELVLVFDTFGEPAAAEEDPHVVDPTLTTWAVNGLVDPRWSVPGGSVVRVRLLNASNAGYLAVADQHVIAHDQGLLAAPTDGDVLVAPGDRVELEWRVGDGLDVLRRPWTVAGGPALGEPVRLLEVEADPPAAVPAGLAWPFAGGAPTEDPGTTDLRFLLTGSPDLGWEMNGETFPDVTAPVVALGEELVIEVRNASPASHPFHVHGHAFEVLSMDGVAPVARTIEDTIDVPIYGLARLALTADNPGTWMTHCHVLPHAEGGMMTLLVVEP